MTDLHCKRWIALSDREATQEPVSDVEAAWLRDHAAQCPHCGSEARLWSTMAGIMAKPALLDVPVDGLLDHPSRAADGDRPRRLGRRLVWGFGLAAGLACVFVATSLFPRQRPLQKAETARPVFAQLLSVAGDVRVGLRAARAGDVLGEKEKLTTAQGRACLGIAESITTCLDAMSAATVSLADPTQLTVYLERGRLMSRLDGQPSNRKFVVRTVNGSILAKGTRFLVEVDAEQTTVHLHEGSIGIRAANDVSGDLTAPARATVAGEIHVEPWSEAIVLEDQALSNLSGLPRTGQRTRLEVVTKPAGASVSVDDMVLGPAPVSALLLAGHRLNIALDGYAPVNELLPTVQAEVLERSFELSALPSQATNEVTSTGAKPMAFAKVAPASTGTPSTLLARAQLLRSQGRYRECAASYRQLSVRYPRSDEARVSLVSLGELDLSELAQPAQALRAFEDYLRMGGSLSREARFGRIRALRMLSKNADEQEAIAAFLRDYPSSIQAASLRSKLPSR